MAKFKKGDVIVRTGETIHSLRITQNEKYVAKEVLNYSVRLEGKDHLYDISQFELVEPEYKVFKDLTNDEKLELIKLYMTGVPFERRSVIKDTQLWSTIRYKGQSVNFKPNYMYRVKDLEPIKKELEEINTQIQELLDKADMLSKKL